MEEEERTRRLAKFRTMLEKRVRKAQTELEDLRFMLDIVDATLLDKGFRRAKIEGSIPPPPATTSSPTPVQVVSLPSAEYERTVPLKTVSGELLADLYIGKDSMRVVLAEDKEFNINTPPFKSFFLERVLTRMRGRDQEAAESGEINLEKILSYNITRDGEKIREITILNTTPNRSRELKSTIRWTLEKMHEKTKAGS